MGRGVPSALFITGKECPWQPYRPCGGAGQTNLAAILNIDGRSRPWFVCDRWACRCYRTIPGTGIVR